VKLSEVLVKFFDPLLHQGCGDITREKGQSEVSEVIFENFLYFTFSLLLPPFPISKEKKVFSTSLPSLTSLLNHISQLWSEV
jgi:hypothetical protein